MNGDEILTRVRVVSQLRDGERLRLRGGRICVEGPSYFSFLLRYLSDDNRYTTVAYLQQLVADVEQFLASTDTCQWRARTLRMLLGDLAGSLLSLKKTYNDDNWVIASIQTLVDRLTQLNPSSSTITATPSTNAANDQGTTQRHEHSRSNKRQ